MNRKFFSLTVLSLFVLNTYSQELVLKKGMVLGKTIKIKKANYAFDAFDSLNKGAIVIEGNNIVIDFNNAILKGSSAKQKPDEFFGTAIIVKNGKNITIKNLVAKGYKVALLARNVEGLKIENCEFSYNYRQHLNSTPQKEDISDWLSYHHNEGDEWLRYGAGMYLRECNNAIINNCKVTGGQNALMMMECNNGLIYNNDFSFNSGIGIGMYRSNYNQFLFNRVNFNVRGFSYGVYSRGQDSAGFLVYEQSSNNMFYKNSVTHSGDGFFLWAGQTTMDTGEGGCNNNKIWSNDFSYAPTNGIEITFSSNHIYDNRIYECDHGIWGGYSYNTVINKNKFRDNRIAIAIEHGQHNYIEENIFSKDREAIRLWSRESQPEDWGYAKYHDTRSVDYVITLNSFNQNPLVYNFTKTDSLRIYNNRYAYPGEIFRVDSTVSNIDSLIVETPDTGLIFPTIKNPIDPFKGNGVLVGRDKIMMTEWGPYDFKYPFIRNTNPADSSANMQFKVFGPKGRLRIISTKGIDIFKTESANFPYQFIGSPQGNQNIEIVMEYNGPSFTDAFGNKIPANKPYRFSFYRNALKN